MLGKLCQEEKEMKPSNLIKSKCKTKSEQLSVCFSLIDYFCGESEAKWAINVRKKRGTQTI
jgi:hypothetical protein